jgi:hypothetical protein
VRSARYLLLAGLLLTVPAGCGGSTHKSASAGRSTGAPPPPPPPSLPPGVVAPNAPAVHALAGRVLRAGDIAGFTSEGEAAATNPKAWVAVESYPPAERASEAARLERLGFVSAKSEHLAPPARNGPEALSTVILFRSPGSALANIQQEVKTNEARGAKPFAVAGVPGAKGFGGAFGSATGYNVAFAAGPYYYLAGVGYPTGTKGAPTKEQLIAAAQRLSVRAHG